MDIHINLLGTFDGKVTFRIIDEDDNVAYRTNGNGEGLWKRNATTGEWKQIIGTSQFHLLQKTDSGKRKAIRRLFEYGNDTFR